MQSPRNMIAFPFYKNVLHKNINLIEVSQGLCGYSKYKTFSEITFAEFHALF